MITTTESVGDVVFRIALCDNSKEDLMALREELQAWQSGHSSFECSLVCFDDPQKLQKTLTHNFYDLYILDILMPAVSGIELARIIRKTNLNVPIIFTTTSREFALDAYGIHACRYLIKPVNWSDLDEAMNYVSRRGTQKTQHPISIHSGSELYTVAREDIMYIENVVRTSIYVTKDGREIKETRRNGVFEDAVAEATKDPCFVQTHKSYFVNMNYIRSMNSNSIEMDNGAIIPVNRKRSNDVQLAYLNFINGESDQNNESDH